MVYYLIILNIISFFIYGFDKRMAIKGNRRVSEYHLLVLSLFGGCIGSLLGMKVFHHKTKKLKFWILNIIFTILWIIMIINN